MMMIAGQEIRHITLIAIGVHANVRILPFSGLHPGSRMTTKRGKNPGLSILLLSPAVHDYGRQHLALMHPCSTTAFALMPTSAASVLRTD
jgi:hypothetical protein